MSQVYQPQPLVVEQRSLGGRWQSAAMEARPRRNAFGLAALATGLLSVILAVIPVVGSVSSLFGPLAVIFGLLGRNRRRARQDTATAGIVLGVASLAVSIIVTMLGGYAFPMGT